QKLSKYFRFVFESGSSRGQAQASYTRSAEASKRCITRAIALALIAALFFPSCRRMLSIAQDLLPRRPAACLQLALSSGVGLIVRKEPRPRACPTRLSVPLYETEAMAKRIAAESSRAVLGVFEHLLLLGTSIERPRQSRFKIVNMNVEMHGRPVSLVSA